MSIFARRTLQRLLEQALNAGLPKLRARTLIRDINSSTHRAHEAEWELVVFAALAACCDVEYEPSRGGSTRADVLCLDRDARFPPVLVEITTVSDRGSDERNPVSELFAAMVKEANSQGVWPNHLSLDAGSKQRRAATPASQILALPPRGDIAAFIKGTVRPFLRKVCSDRANPAKLQVRDSGIHLEIGYDPRQQSARITHEGYRHSGPLQGTLFNALRGKARQIKKSGHAGPAGIVVCDAGSSHLRDQTYTPQVAKEVLRNYSSVGFIAHIGISTWRHYGNRSPGELRRRGADLAPTINIHRNVQALNAIPDAFEAMLIEAVESLPPASSAPESAYSGLGGSAGPLAGSFYGGLRIRGNELSLSLRAVHALMGGTVAQSEFLDAHGWGHERADRHGLNFLANMLESGHSILSSRIERQEDADDDWLILTISRKPDPALAGLRLPG